MKFGPAIDALEPREVMGWLQLPVGETGEGRGQAKSMRAVLAQPKASHGSRQAAQRLGQGWKPKVETACGFG